MTIFMTIIASFQPGEWGALVPGPESMFPLQLRNDGPGTDADAPA